MSIIAHNDGMELELTVRHVYKAERFDMGGVINSDYFAKHPFDAALLALAPFYYNGICVDKISAFLQEYYLSYDYVEEIENIDEFTQQFKDELDTLVKECRTKLQ